MSLVVYAAALNIPIESASIISQKRGESFGLLYDKFYIICLLVVVLNRNIALTCIQFASKCFCLPILHPALLFLRAPFQALQRSVLSSIITPLQVIYYHFKEKCKYEVYSY